MVFHQWPRLEEIEDKRLIIAVNTHKKTFLSYLAPVGELDVWMDCSTTTGLLDCILIWKVGETYNSVVFLLEFCTRVSLPAQSISAVFFSLVGASFISCTRCYHGIWGRTVLQQWDIGSVECVHTWPKRPADMQWDAVLLQLLSKRHLISKRISLKCSWCYSTLSSEDANFGFVRYQFIQCL